jgi:hypothetical protein
VTDPVSASTGVIWTRTVVVRPADCEPARAKAASVREQARVGKQSRGGLAERVRPRPREPGNEVWAVVAAIVAAHPGAAETILLLLARGEGVSLPHALAL